MMKDRCLMAERGEIQNDLNSPFSLFWARGIGKCWRRWQINLSVSPRQWNSVKPCVVECCRSNLSSAVSSHFQAVFPSGPWRAALERASRANPQGLASPSPAVHPAASPYHPCFPRGNPLACGQFMFYCLSTSVCMSPWLHTEFLAGRDHNFNLKKLNITERKQEHL